MSGTPKIQSFELDHTIESISKGQFLSVKLTEGLAQIIKKAPQGKGVTIILHDFNSSLKHTSIEMVTPQDLLTLVELLSEEKKNDPEFFENCFDILILPHEFMLSLDDASDIVNIPSELLIPMLQDKGICTDNKSVLLRDLLNFEKQRDDQKKKAYKALVKSKGHLFGIE